MQIHLEFKDKQADFSALEIARLLCDLQHLTVFALAIAADDLQSEFLFDPYFQKYEYMIVADVPFAAKVPITDSRLFVKEISLQSPLRIAVGFLHDVKLARRLSQVWEALKQIIAIDLMRERMSFENENMRQKAEITRQEAEVMRQKAEIARQRAIAEALKNYDAALRILGRIKDPAKRSMFERNLISAIEPFVDGRYPQIEKMEIIDPRKRDS